MHITIALQSGCYLDYIWNPLRKRIILLFFVGAMFPELLDGQTGSVRNQVLVLEAPFSSGYIITHPFRTPRFDKLFQFTNRLDSSRLYNSYHLKEENPYYRYSEIIHAELLGDTVLRLEGNGSLASFDLYENIIASGRYRVTAKYLKSNYGGGRYRYFTDETGRNYIMKQQYLNLRLGPDDFQQFTITNHNIWVQSEEEKRKIKASRRLGYSIPRTIGAAVIYAFTAGFFIAVEYLL
jgi:hypothetical protein